MLSKLQEDSQKELTAQLQDKVPASSQKAMHPSFQRLCRKLRTALS